MSQPILNSITLKALSVVPVRLKKTAFIEIPEKIGTVKQHLGFSSRRWTITGSFSGSTKTTDRDNLQNIYDNNTTIVFTNEEGTSYNVKILDFQPFNANYGTKIIYNNMLIEEIESE